MEGNINIKGRPNNKHKQTYNGRTFTLHSGEKYLNSGPDRMHRYVWECENNKQVPKGFHVHHVNGNCTDNRIENLELIEAFKHLSNHAKKRFKENKEWADKFIKCGQEAAKVWHGSEDGIKWHKEHAKKMGFGNLTFGQVKCELCKEEFTAKVFKQKYCSKKCKAKSRRLSGVDDVQRECCVCKKEYTTNKYRKNKCCSRKCGGDYRKSSL